MIPTLFGFSCQTVNGAATLPESERKRQRLSGGVASLNPQRITGGTPNPGPSFARVPCGVPGWIRLPKFPRALFVAAKPVCQPLAKRAEDVLVLGLGDVTPRRTRFADILAARRVGCVGGSSRRFRFDHVVFRIEQGNGEGVGVFDRDVGRVDRVERMTSRLVPIADRSLHFEAGVENVGFQPIVTRVLVAFGKQRKIVINKAVVSVRLDRIGPDIIIEL